MLPDQESRRYCLRENDRSLIRSAAVIVFFIGALFVSQGRAYAEADFVQSATTFEKAIRNRSTHTYVIFATIVDDRTGEAHSACIPAPLFLGAIHREYDLKYDAPSIEKAIEIALANPTREFHFSKQAAIDNIPLPGKETPTHLERRLREACVLVRQGESVFLADITGQVGVDRTSR
jgi:hypothetical protein